MTAVTRDKAEAGFEAVDGGLERPVIAFERSGKHNRRIYDASWHEWRQRNDLPKESV